MWWFLTSIPVPPVWVVLSILTVVLLYLYGIWPYSFFSERGIPGPKPLPFIGNFVDFFSKAAYANEREWVRKYGKIFGYYLGRKPVVCIYDIDLIETIMVKEFSKYVNREGGDPINRPMNQGIIFLADDHWRGVRNIILPTFSSGKLRQMCGVIKNCGKRLEEKFQDLVDRNENADLKDLFGSFALEVISATAFGIQVDAQRDKNDIFLKHVKNIFKMNIPIIYLVVRTFPFLKPLTDYFDMGIWPSDSIRFFGDTVKQTVEARINDNEKRIDFLQLLINAESNEGITEKSSTGNVLSQGGKKKLSQEELIAQAFLFFIAGFETTATLMTFTGYNLARYPECQQKVYAEIMEVLGDKEPTYELVSKLPYLEQCLNETLRMFPPIQSMTRITKEDVVLGGFNIPKDTVIHLPFYYLHHDPDIYPDPFVFNPERFSSESRASRNPAHFLGFGYGPRICIGNRLALLEAKISFSYLIRKFEFVRCDETLDNVPLMPGPILIPVKPVKIGVKLRQ